MFGKLSIVVKNLIIINCLIWLASITLPQFIGVDLNETFGLHYFAAEKFRPMQLITYMFLHAGFEHLFFNMFSLFMLGSLLESYWGPKRFLTYYILTGIGAALTQEFAWYMSLREITAEFNAIANGGIVSPIVVGQQIISSVPELFSLKAAIFNRFVTIGASGAVFGILLAFGMIFSNLKLFVFPIPIPVKAKYFVILYGLFELFGGIRSVSGTGDGIAHFAHLGGMIFGIILILLWKKNSGENSNFTL